MVYIERLDEIRKRKLRRARNNKGRAVPSRKRVGFLVGNSADYAAVYKNNVWIFLEESLCLSGEPRRYGIEIQIIERALSCIGAAGCFIQNTLRGGQRIPRGNNGK